MASSGAILVLSKNLKAKRKYKRFFFGFKATNRQKFWFEVERQAKQDSVNFTNMFFFVHPNSKMPTLTKKTLHPLLLLKIIRI